MKYGTCVRCLAEWQPKEYWNSKAMIYYKGCTVCGNMSYWSGGEK